MGKKCLITGAAGFIGSSLALQLVRDGWHVTGVDNLSTGRADFIDDLRDVGANCFVEDYGSEWTCQLVREQAFDTIFHVGATPRVVYSVEHPAETNYNNVTKTLRLLEACKGNVGRVVFSSSSSVVGNTAFFPTDETQACRPLSPYALQKRTIEQYCRMFNMFYELDSICLRYFNVYGPRQYGDSPYSTVISAWCQALHDGKPLRLDGTGEQTRDFCYIDNVVQANVLAATSTKKFVGEPINIAHGQCHSVNDILRMFKYKFGDVEVVHAPARAGDVDKTHANIAEARKLIGYTPTVKFEEGLEETLRWWKIF